MEFRAADATGSPHLALAMLIRAGIEGLRAHLPQPPIVKGDPETMTGEDRARLGIHRLPASLPEALAALEADSVVCSWVSPTFLDCYLGMKRKEMAIVADLDDHAICRRYAEMY